MKNILLFDIDATLRSNIISSLAADSQWAILGDGSDSSDLSGYISGQSVDVLLMGFGRPLIECFELVSWTKSASPATNVVSLVPVDKEGSFAVPQFIDGINAYLLSNVEPVELLFCLQLVSEGDKYLSNELYLTIMADKLRVNPVLETFASQQTAFSKHEIQLLQFIARGMSEASIGRHLSMSLPAVKRHFELLFAKTGTFNHASLIRFAVQNGIVS